VPVFSFHQEWIKFLVSESADLAISWQSFDHGYFLTVRAIQELRDKKCGSVLVGIGGPSGSGKSRLVNCTEALKHWLLFYCELDLGQFVGKGQYILYMKRIR